LPWRLRLREDYDAARLRELAKRSADAAQTRRLLALAAIYAGGSRSEAAQKLSARPRHHAQDAEALEAFKKRMARPVRNRFLQPDLSSSASTYPARGHGGSGSFKGKSGATLASPFFLFCDRSILDSKVIINEFVAQTQFHPPTNISEISYAFHEIGTSFRHAPLPAILQILRIDLRLNITFSLPASFPNLRGAEYNTN
jgi:hypothetical protein